MTLFIFTKNAFHKRPYSIFIFRRLVFSCGYLSRYVPRVVPLSGLQALYINDSNGPPNGKIEKSWASIKSPQFRPNIVAIRIGLRMENHEIMSPYRMPPIWALFRPPVWPAGPVFLTLRPRLCSLSISGLAVENSASAENRKGAS